MAREGLRGIAFAFKDVSVDVFRDSLQNFNDTDMHHNFGLMEHEMTFTGIFGLKDPLRKRVEKVVKYANQGHLTMRIVSGDNLETVTAVAREAGVIDVSVETS